MAHRQTHSDGTKGPSLQRGPSLSPAAGSGRLFMLTPSSAELSGVTFLLILCLRNTAQGIRRASRAAREGCQQGSGVLKCVGGGSHETAALRVGTVFAVPACLGRSNHLWYLARDWQSGCRWGKIAFEPDLHPACAPCAGPHLGAGLSEPKTHPRPCRSPKRHACCALAAAATTCAHA